MKQKFFITILVSGILSSPLMFSSCRNSSSKQQIEIVTPSTYGEWEDWCKVNVRFDDRGKLWGKLSERHEVQRRIVNGEKEYRIFFSGEWFPVTETVANVEYGETMHYRFVAKGCSYYFDM